jgi:hypothetical protein
MSLGHCSTAKQIQYREFGTKRNVKLDGDSVIGHAIAFGPIVSYVTKHLVSFIGIERRRSLVLDVL